MAFHSSESSMVIEVVNSKLIIRISDKIFSESDVKMNDHYSCVVTVNRYEKSLHVDLFLNTVKQTEDFELTQANQRRRRLEEVDWTIDSTQIHDLKIGFRPFVGDVDMSDIYEEHEDTWTEIEGFDIWVFAPVIFGIAGTTITLIIATLYAQRKGSDPP
eukprot:UN30255